MVHGSLGFVVKGFASQKVSLPEKHISDGLRFDPKPRTKGMGLRTLGKYGLKKGPRIFRGTSC